MNQVNPVSLGYPLSVFNKNSTLKGKALSSFFATSQLASVTCLYFGHSVLPKQLLVAASCRYFRKFCKEYEKDSSRLCTVDINEGLEGLACCFRFSRSS